jgi:hypothetical protein
MLNAKKDRDADLDEQLGLLMGRCRRTEEDIKESDLMKHPGILHTI